MRLCILEADTLSDLELDEHGTVSEMFQTWLGPALEDADWSSVAVHSGESLPDPDAFQSYLITGSRFGVYDETPWMDALTDFIRRLRDLHIPVAGFCFGHQVMAHAYGARVEKYAGGWVLGAETYGSQTAFAMHQDQVLEIPPGAAKVLGSARCEIARIEYEFPAMSVQYHPEFSAGFMEGLLDLYGTGKIDADLIEAARASLETQTHVTSVAEDFAAFFRSHRGD